MNKNFVIAALLVALVCVTVYSTMQVNVPVTSLVPGTLGIYSSVCIYVNDEQIGDCTHNAMMDVGLNWTRDLIGDAGTSGSVKNIALGNTTTAETITLTSIPGQINGCVLAPAAGTYAVVGSSKGNFSVTYEWTQNGCPGIVVNTTALYNISAPGSSCTSTNCTMFAGKNFDNSVTLQNGDKLNVTWYVWVV
jgi:hypothetical protein